MRAGLNVTPTSSPTGFVVADDVMGVRAEFRTPTPVRPKGCSTEPFCLPVDDAVVLRTRAVRIPKFPVLIVRDGSGEVACEVAGRETRSLGPGVWTVELSSTAVKTYLHVEGGFTTYADEDGRVVEAADATRFRIGTRSRHDHPAATVTVPETPEGVAAALSQFGSALKTTSPERSWPTLRGHPPLLERGDELHVPESLSSDRRTRRLVVEVPPSLRYLYPVTSLAFFLDARVELGARPRLRTDDHGWTFPLDDTTSGGAAGQTDARGRRHVGGSRSFEERVARTLQHLFTFECVTRTEGLYPFDLDERRRVERRLAETGRSLDFGALYDAPLADRTRAYLDVPFDVVTPAVPRWKLTADVAPRYDGLEHLPYVADDLGVVRCLSPSPQTDERGGTTALDAFVRGGDAEPGGPTGPSGASERPLPTATDTTNGRLPGDSTERGGDDTPESAAPSRGDGGSASPTLADETVVVPRPTDSIEQVWVGDGYPVGGTKPDLGASRRRLDATASGEVDVAVVANDPEMREELAVSGLYGLRDLVAFSVETYEEVTRAELVDLLQTDCDFLHYVGHVDERGLQCADGYLDAATLDRVAVRAFMLNACRSYVQAHHLVDAGAIGGVATVENVENAAATGLGRTVARLLNAGFSLGGAIDVLGSETAAGDQYLVVGDQNLTVAQNRSGIPMRWDLVRTDDGRFEITVHGFPTRGNLGGIYAPTVDGVERRFLGAGRMTTLTMSAREFQEFCSMERLPVTTPDHDGVCWSDDLPDDVDPTL
ncbi:hypothetical protein ACFPYI_00235 [Halomarina salina]|uniref:Caspase domain-containing protein n=1 Tax=Halomarina salina TaxID=1872699 RepID=A0ABD5RGP6_9EURY|nr:hypothetical protein [Halomarina salina]